LARRPSASSGCWRPLGSNGGRNQTGKASTEAAAPRVIRTPPDCDRSCLAYQQREYSIACAGGNSPSGVPVIDLGLELCRLLPFCLLDTRRQAQCRSLWPKDVGGLAHASLRPIWRVTRLFPSDVTGVAPPAAQVSG
jgi:hypothetical protein